jgi:hypothetical protein
MAIAMYGRVTRRARRALAAQNVLISFLSPGTAFASESRA